MVQGGLEKVEELPVDIPTGLLNKLHKLPIEKLDKIPLGKLPVEKTGEASLDKVPEEKISGRLFRGSVKSSSIENQAEPLALDQ